MAPQHFHKQLTFKENWLKYSVIQVFGSPDRILKDETFTPKRMLITSFQIDLECWGFHSFGFLTDELKVSDVFECFKTSPHLLQLFRRMLQRCEAPDMFCGYETPLSFPSASGWVDNDWILIFGWTYPLTKPASQMSLFSVFIIGANFKVWFKETKEKLPTHIQITEFVAN